MITNWEIAKCVLFDAVEALILLIVIACVAAYCGS